MTLTYIVRNLRTTAQFVRQDLRDYVKKTFRDGSSDLTEKEKKCLMDLKRDGYAVIENYWPRKKAEIVQGKLEAFLAGDKNKDFESGAYLRVREGGEDGGVRRIYHVDRMDQELKGFREDPFMNRIVEEYYGFPFFSGVLVFQHNLKTTSNTRYHHVDWFGKQFKTFLYLDDVDHGNGPFTYIKGTHRCHWMRIKKQMVGNKKGSPTSFYERDVRSVIHREVQICGKAGTLILADVRGLHRGSPQINRSRSILVNYMYPTSGEVFLEREQAA